uniref:Chloride channel CLIC-like protein 1 n=1 Tax=Oryzias latipes TaxID=8090 RepID=A0A286P9Y4_ORYLA|nr:chloride channel CLIC-like [Oryzias latipes]
MLWLFLLSCSLVLSNSGQTVNGEWLDPFDMLNYEARTKTMKNSEVGQRGMFVKSNFFETTYFF